LGQDMFQKITPQELALSQLAASDHNCAGE